MNQPYTDKPTVTGIEHDAHAEATLSQATRATSALAAAMTGRDDTTPVVFAVPPNCVPALLAALWDYVDSAPCMAVDVSCDDVLVACEHHGRAEKLLELWAQEYDLPEQPMPQPRTA